MTGETILVPRVACAVLTAVVALILYRRGSSARATAILSGFVILAGVANILVNTPQRVAHSNQSHYMEAGETADGVLQLEKAVALMPHDARAHFNLAQARTQTGDLDGAERSLKRALLIAPDFRVAADLLGKIEGKRSAAVPGQ
jgi:Flp pilus assembly protein TadD